VNTFPPAHFAAEKIGGFDGDDFRYAERLNGSLHLSEGDAIHQEKRKIPLDAGEAR